MIVQYNLKKLFAIIQYPVPNKAAGGMVLFLWRNIMEIDKAIAISS